jgi:hypothetical protein
MRLGFALPQVGAERRECGFWRGNTRCYSSAGAGNLSGRACPWVRFALRFEARKSCSAVRFTLERHAVWAPPAAGRLAHASTRGTPHP